MQLKTVDYSVFRAELMAEIEKRKGADETVSLQVMLKNNDITREGIVIRKKGRDICATIYVDEVFREREKGIPVGELAEQVLMAARKDAPSVRFVQEKWKSYESVRDRICYRLLSAERNREFLKEHPHRRVLDLAMVYYYPLGEEDGLMASILVCTGDLERWGVEEETLYRDAVRNTPRLCPASLDRVQTILGALRGEAGSFPADGTEAVPLYVLTNRQGWYGAASMLYEGAVGTFAKEVQRNLFILPSSVHEVLLYPDDGCYSAEELAACVKEINREHVAPKEVLSDHVYLYRMDRDEIAMA